MPRGASSGHCGEGDRTPGCSTVRAFRLRAAKCRPRDGGEASASLPFLGPRTEGRDPLLGKGSRRGRRPARKGRRRLPPRLREGG
eukprot:9900529-Alexandrium_andersonii.AAC.1